MIKAQDKSLWERIKDFISGLVEKIRTAYKGLDPASKEGKLVREMKDSAERLQRLWTEAVLDASEVDVESTPKSEGVKYSFAGKKAKTADKLKLATAEQMLADGVDAETVRQNTGWFKGYDGKWRFEIDDSKMLIDTRGSYSNNPDVRRYNELVDKVYFGDGGTVAEKNELELLMSNLEGVSLTPKTLGETIKHDALFAAYPELKNIPIRYCSECRSAQKF